MSSAARPSTVWFWQNTPSPHQAPMIAELARRWTGAVRVVIETPLDEARREMGWPEPDYGAADVVVAPDASARAAAEAAVSDTDVHVFSGLRGYVATRGSYERLLAARRRIFVYTEPWDPRGPRGSVRHVLYRRAARQVDGRLAGLLVTGSNGLRQYGHLGLRRTPIVPFGYFPSVPSAASFESAADADESGAVRLCYVGSLIPRKGVGALLDALGEVREHRWRLDVVGHGPDADGLRERARVREISDRVRWTDRIANAEVGGLLTTTDVLVLPSRHDGWGAVVNEALLCGSRVIVSARAGSADLVAGPQQGFVVDPDDRPALTRALAAAIADGRQDSAARRALRDWAVARCSAAAGADYLQRILTTPDERLGSVQPPWSATA